MTCPLCLGTAQAFWEEYDVVHGLWVPIHGDNQCKRCKGTGKVLPLASRPTPDQQEALGL